MSNKHVMSGNAARLTPAFTVADDGMVRISPTAKFPPAPADSTSNRPSHGAGSGISEFLRKRLPSILHMGGGRG